jgi:hypothetical protein
MVPRIEYSSYRTGMIGNEQQESTRDKKATADAVGSFFGECHLLVI